MIGIRFETDGAYTELGPVFGLHYGAKGLELVYDDGATEQATLADGKWHLGKREYERVVLFPWPEDQDAGG